MAFTLMHSVTASKGINGDISPQVDTTGANLIVIAFAGFTGGTEPTDNLFQDYDALTPIGGFVQLFYKYNPSTSTTHSFTVIGVSAVIGVLVFSGAAASPFDDEAGNTVSGGTSVAVGNLVPTEDNEVFVVGMNGGNTAGLAIDNGFTIEESVTGGGNFDMRLAYKIQTTAATLNPTWSWTGSGNGQTAGATFKAAAVAGALVRSTMGPTRAAVNRAGNY